MKQLYLPLLLIVSLLIFPSCRDENDEPQPQTLYDIAELVSNSEPGAVFRVYLPDAEEAAVLTARGQTLKGMEPGKCAMIRYIPTNGKAYTTTDITLRQYAPITTTNLMKAVPENLSGWDTDGVWLMSLWRAGDYVIVRAKIEHSPAPRYYRLIVDESTLGDEIPTAYLYHKITQPADSYMQEYYTAYRVANLWSYPNVSALRIRVSNTNMPDKTEFIIPNPRPHQPQRID